MLFARPSTLIIALSFILACLSPSRLTAQGPIDSYQLTVPTAGAEMVEPTTSLSLRPGDIVESDTDEIAKHISVRGSISGAHNGSITTSVDKRTILFDPESPFVPGEQVTVAVREGIALQNGSTSEPLRYMFTVTSTPQRMIGTESGVMRIERELERSAASASREKVEHTSPQSAVDWTDSVSSDAISSLVPDDFPDFTIRTRGETADGHAFVALFNNPASPTDLTWNWLIILGNDGEPRWFRRLDGAVLDFKVQPNGSLSYFEIGNPLGFIELDSNFNEIDHWRTKNGYDPDIHELLLLDNGNALMMSYHEQIVDMSDVVEGGDTAAIVTGLIIQEQDSEHNVVFEWRSWDHFEITDVDPDEIDLTAHRIDYVHGNAIEVDFDDNLLISNRHLNEVTKIDRVSGDVIWRLGGTKSDFTFTNDIGFSHQHDIRRLDNGHITLFDNGNFHEPSVSRAVEYVLDEEGMTATRVWEYRPDNGRVSPAMGSSRRLPNGNTFVGWGFVIGDFLGRVATEVDANADEVYELEFAPEAMSYRSFRSPWEGAADKPYLWHDDRNDWTADSVLLKMRTFGREDEIEMYYVFAVDDDAEEVLVDSTQSQLLNVEGLERGHAYSFRSVGRDASGAFTDTSNSVAFSVLPIGPIVVSDPGVVTVDTAIVLAPNHRQDAVALKNVGENPLRISSLEFQGENASAFSIPDASLPMTIPPAQSAQLSLDIVPSVSGSLSASLVVRSDAVNAAELTVPVSGVAAGSELAGKHVDFGVKPIGSTTDSTISGIVENRGDGPVTIESIQIAHDYFVLQTAPLLPYTLESGDGLAITIGFTPLQGREYRGTVEIDGDGSPKTILLNLRGHGDTTSSVSTMQSPAQAVLVAPSPFQDLTTVTVDLRTPAIVGMYVYDASGGLVRTMEPQRFEAGSSEILWNGMDATGARLPSGAYTIRVFIGGTPVDRKVQLVR